jgi:hypothetical protein
MSMKRMCGLLIVGMITASTAFGAVSKEQLRKTLGQASGNDKEFSTQLGTEERSSCGHTAYRAEDSSGVNRLLNNGDDLSVKNDKCLDTAKEGDADRMVAFLEAHRFAVCAELLANQCREALANSKTALKKAELNWQLKAVLSFSLLNISNGGSGASCAIRATHDGESENFYFFDVRGPGDGIETVTMADPSSCNLTKPGASATNYLSAYLRDREDTLAARKAKADAQAAADRAKEAERIRRAKAATERTKQVKAALGGDTTTVTPPVEQPK